MDKESKAAQSKRFRAAEHPLLILAAFLLVCLGPFLNKAVHIDDPLFVWSAEWIQKHPLDFYGFNVNWYGLEWPMHITNQNPPATAYLLALTGSFFGFPEIALHGVFLLVAFAAVAGIHRLARLWCGRPLLATMVAMVTPVFLVSGTTLMCDMLLLALWVWTVVFWETALRDGGAVRLPAAGGLAALAVLTKYSAFMLLPVLVFMGALRRRRPGWWLLAFLAPAAALGAYELASTRLYHHGLLSFAADFARTQQDMFQGGWTSRLISGLAFGGGCLLPVLFFAPLLWPRAVALSATLMAFAGSVFALSFVQAIGPVNLCSGGGLRWGFVLQTALLMTGGLHLLGLILVELWRGRDAVTVMLAAWIGAVLLFFFVLNWTVNARSLLPIVPAVAILLIRRLDRVNPAGIGWSRLCLPLAASLAVSLCVAAADFQLANSARLAARTIAARYNAEGGRLWFEGHWGFQYYLEKLGARPVDFEHSTLQPGDILVIPSNNSNMDWPKPGEVGLLKEFKLRVFPWLSTMCLGSGAGFYAADYGPLPFVAGAALPESYTVFQVLRPLQFRSSRANYRLGGATLDSQGAPLADPNSADRGATPSGR